MSTALHENYSIFAPAEPLHDDSSLDDFSIDILTAIMVEGDDTNHHAAIASPCQIDTILTEKSMDGKNDGEDIKFDELLIEPIKIDTFQEDYADNHVSLHCGINDSPVVATRVLPESGDQKHYDLAMSETQERLLIDESFVIIEEDDTEKKFLDSDHAYEMVTASLEVFNEEITNVDDIIDEMEIESPTFAVAIPEDIHPGECFHQNLGGWNMKIICPENACPNAEIYVDVPAKTDVLKCDSKKGKDTKLENHPGNLQLKSLAKEKYEEYTMISERHQKTAFYDSIRKMVHSRYWKQEDGAWVEITTPKEIRDFIASKFKNITKAKKRRKDALHDPPMKRRKTKKNQSRDSNLLFDLATLSIHYAEIE